MQLQQIREFVEGVGQAQLAELQKTLPGVFPDITEMLPIPCPDGQAYWIPSMGSEQASKAAAYASVSNKTNLGLALEKEWSEMHQTIPLQNCPTINVESVGPRDCRAAGFCICQGSLLYRFRNAVLAAMKQTFVSKTDKDRLIDGRIVMCLVRDMFCGECDDFRDDLPSHVWLHIGSMSLSPYRPTFQEMHQAGPCEGDHDLGTVMLQARPIQTMTPLS